jgi:hypothetical protein
MSLPLPCGGSGIGRGLREGLTEAERYAVADQELDPDPRKVALGSSIWVSSTAIFSYVLLDGVASRM